RVLESPVPSGARPLRLVHYGPPAPVAQVAGVGVAHDPAVDPRVLHAHPQPVLPAGPGSGLLHRILRGAADLPPREGGGTDGVPDDGSRPWLGDTNPPLVAAAPPLRCPRLGLGLRARR